MTWDRQTQKQLFPNMSTRNWASQKPLIETQAILALEYEQGKARYQVTGDSKFRSPQYQGIRPVHWAQCVSTKLYQPYHRPHEHSVLGIIRLSDIKKQSDIQGKGLCFWETLSLRLAVLLHYYHYFSDLQQEYKKNFLNMSYFQYIVLVLTYLRYWPFNWNYSSKTCLCTRQINNNLQGL
jgi:hypothetical protein